MAIAVLAITSAWLVMLALSVEDAAVTTSGRSATKAAMRPLWRAWWPQVAWVYAMPLLIVAAARHAGYIASDTALGLALCVAAGSGTSGASLASMAGAPAGPVKQWLLLSIAASLLLVPAAVYVFSTADLAPRAAVAAAATGLFAQLLPYAAGRALLRPRRGTWTAWLKRAADASVLALIAVVLVREIPRLTQEPDLLLNVTVLALLLWLGGRLAAGAQSALALLALVRNLTGAMAVAAVLPTAGNPMLTLSAFGLPMYGLALPLALQARRSLALREALAAKPGP